MKSSYIVSLIPARSGSKGIIDKNIITFKSKPLIAHSIEQSLSSNYIHETFVSTDSLKYQKIAQKYGANVPFLRPSNISDDLSTDYEVFEHFLNFLQENKQRVPDVIVHLRTTYPTRKTLDINKALEQFLENYEHYDSLRSVVKAPQTPYKMWHLNGECLDPLLTLEEVKEPYNEPRQNLPEVYWQNACIDIVKTSTLINKKSMTGDSICAYVMKQNEIHDIDELIDLQRVVDAEI